MDRWGIKGLHHPQLAASLRACSQPGTTRNVIVGLGLAVALATAEATHGTVTLTLRTIRRAMAAAFSAILEEQSGLELLTPDGEEPVKRPAPASSALAWETLSAREKAASRRGRSAPSHAATEPRDGGASSGSDTAGLRGLRRPRASIDSDGGSSSDTPNFFASTKLLACLDLQHSQELYEAAVMIDLEPNETLFRIGEDSESGMFIVVSGSVGVYLQEGDDLVHTNTLFPGESVGDLDVLDGLQRGVTCLATEEGALMVQISRELFLSFVATQPKALQVYLQKAMARLWRVAHFVLTDYLELPPQRGSQHAHTAMLHAPTLGSALRHYAQPAGPTGSSPPAAPAAQPQDTAREASAAAGAASNGGQAAALAEGSGSLGPAVAGTSDTFSGFSSGNGGHPAAQQQAILVGAPVLASQRVESVASDITRYESASSVIAAAPAAPAAALPDSRGRKEPVPEPRNALHLVRSAVKRTADAVLQAVDAEHEPAFSDAHGEEQEQEAEEEASEIGLSAVSEVGLGANFNVGGFTGRALLRGAMSGSTETQSDSTSPFSQVPENRIYHARSNLAGEARSHLATLSEGGQGGVAGAAKPTGQAAPPQTAPSSASSLSMAGLMPAGRSRSLGGFDVPKEPRQPSAQQDTSSVPAALSAPRPVPGAGSHKALPPAAASSDEAMQRRRSLVWGPIATLAGGWDVVAAQEGGLTDAAWRDALGGDGLTGVGRPLTLRRGQPLHRADRACRQFYVLIEGTLVAERPSPSGKPETAAVAEGSLVSCVAYLSSTRTSIAVRAAEVCQLLAFGQHELAALLDKAPRAYIGLLLAGGLALAPVIRRFISLGLNRVWLNSGDTIYRQDDPAESLYLLISGRVRLVRQDPTGREPARLEGEVARGEAVGAAWMMTGGAHDNSAVCIRDSELVRMSRGSFELIAQVAPKAVARILEGMARRMSAGVGASGQTSRLTAQPMPPSAAGIARSIGKGTLTGGMRSDVVTIALVPAGVHLGRSNPQADTSDASGLSSDSDDGDDATSTARRRSPQPPARRPPGLPVGRRGVRRGRRQPASAEGTRKLGTALKRSLESLFGPTLHLTSSVVELTFPTAFERLHVGFYRSKITSWMAAQEEDYRFILLEADPDVTPWSRICVSQADCILLVGAHDVGPKPGPLERRLLWTTLDAGRRKSLDDRRRGGGGTPPGMADLGGGAAAGLATATTGPEEAIGTPDWVAEFRRVELVLLHPSDEQPQGTAAWLAPRPQLARHHHLRLANTQDMGRLARWMAGRTVGLVLSGGGSRGLAHLGVLHALDDAGIPVDVIGGTSQGAFMAALYAQGLPWDEAHRKVRTYASRMSSVHHLLQDLTLPLISLFTGRGFDNVIRETFKSGPQRIEDLWLSYFCVTTNLSKGEPVAHCRGKLWRLVRASMTIVGLVPPVFYQGDLLIDGGYLNNMPVDVMHAMGVDKVIVVDVEDRDDSAWRELKPFKGGLSGWKLLWDRVCPFSSLRFGYKLPRYNQIINALTWMSHAVALRRMAQDYVIDLYLRPPVWHYRLMDYHLMDRIVKSSNQYAWDAIAEWQARQDEPLRMLLGAEPRPQPRNARDVTGSAGGGMRRAQSVSCMTQLQAKAAAAAEHETGSRLTSRMSLDITGWSPPDSAASLPAWGVGRSNAEQPAGSSPPESEHGGALFARSAPDSEFRAAGRNSSTPGVPAPPSSERLREGWGDSGGMVDARGGAKRGPFASAEADVPPTRRASAAVSRAEAAPAALSATTFAEEEPLRPAGGQLQEGLRRALGPSASALRWQQAATAVARQRSTALPMSVDMARSPSGMVFAADVHHRTGGSGLLAPSADIQRAPSSRPPLSTALSVSRAASGRLPLSAAAGASRAATASGRLPTLPAPVLKAATRRTPAAADGGSANASGSGQVDEAETRDVAGTSPVAIPASDHHPGPGDAEGIDRLGHAVPLSTAGFSVKDGRAAAQNGVRFAGSPRGATSPRGRPFSSRAARAHVPISGSSGSNSSGAGGRGSRAASGSPHAGDGSPDADDAAGAAWFSGLSEDMRSASTGLMILDDIDEVEEVGSQMEPADSESLDQRIYGLGAWLPAMPEPLPTLDEQPDVASPRPESVEKPRATAAVGVGAAAVPGMLQIVKDARNGVLST